jgi:hypothetical protein
MAPQVRAASEHEGLDPKPGQLRAPKPGLDGDEQKRMIASSAPCSAIGRSKERIDLGACEEVDGAPLKPLVRHREDALDQSGVLGFLEGSVAEERANGGEPDVAAPRRVATFVLDVVQKGADQRRVKIGEAQRGRGLLELLLCEAEEQPKGVAVARDRVGTHPALLDEAVEEECLQEPREIGHGALHDIRTLRSNRAMARCISSGTADRYQYVSLTLVWPR